MTSSNQPERPYRDATQRPGAIVINPPLDPRMMYDPETKRTVDRKTGDYFVSQNIETINRIYRGSICNASGKVISSYEYRYGGSRLPDNQEKSVFEVIWAVRGEDYGGEKTAHEETAARERAKNDSLERLGSFLRAQLIGYSRDGVEKGEIALVDRRKDDLRGEMF